MECLQFLAVQKITYLQFCVTPCFDKFDPICNLQIKKSEESGGGGEIHH